MDVNIESVLNGKMYKLRFGQRESTKFIYLGSPSKGEKAHSRLGT